MGRRPGGGRGSGVGCCGLVNQADVRVIIITMLGGGSTGSLVGEAQAAAGVHIVVVTVHDHCYPPAELHAVPERKLHAAHAAHAEGKCALAHSVTGQHIQVTPPVGQAAFMKKLILN